MSEADGRRRHRPVRGCRALRNPPSLRPSVFGSARPGPRATDPPRTGIPPDAPTSPRSWPPTRPVLAACGWRQRECPAFLALGGDSRSAVRLLHRIHTDFGVTVSLPRFLADPTVRGVADLVAGSSAESPATAARPGNDPHRR
ncbi:MAG TPA: acyl carrier protein [Actinoplanes sp.]|nr:acyl carrier protein [Actinoplanes sp.]